MKVSKTRRERLFKEGKPDIRPCVYDDIKWLWVAAKRAGFAGTAEEFTRTVEPELAAADRLFILEDRNREFAKGRGPVGLVQANYDGWTLCPHVDWFLWATPRNKLRCTVGFLQAMRYTHDVGCIKIFAEGQHVEWFKWLKRYVAISLAGRIPAGRATGEECIFYLRGRKHHGRNIGHRVRRVDAEQRDEGEHNSAAAGSNA